MKGLILKDIIMTWKYCKAFMVIVAAFLVGSVFVQGYSFYNLYPMVIAGIVPYTLFAYEERCKWSAYCTTLPVTRRQIVSSKFLLSLICIATVTVLTVIALMIGMYENGDVDTKEILSVICLLLAIGFISPSIMMPFVFKFSVEKARIAYLIVVGFGSGLSAFFSFNSKVAVAELNSSILLIIGVVMFAVSWLVSIKLYEKKEL